MRAAGVPASLWRRETSPGPECRSPPGGPMWLSGAAVLDPPGAGAHAVCPGGGFASGELLAHGASNAPGRSAALGEDVGGHALALSNQAEQDVLGANEAMMERPRLVYGQLQHLLRPRSERRRRGRKHRADASGTARRAAPPGAPCWESLERPRPLQSPRTECLLYSAADFFEVDPDRPERFGILRPEVGPSPMVNPTPTKRTTSERASSRLTPRRSSALCAGPATPSSPSRRCSVPM